MISIPALYDLFLQYPQVQTDTRKINKNDLFFALKGPNFNGNIFALQALEKGAAYAIVDEQPETANNRIVVVDNVLLILQQLALHHRQQFNIPFLAITGSNGKTTTKELISAVLSNHFTCYTTRGNLNNHIGIPLTILQVQKDAQIAVIEMGANHQKEITGYCTYTLPTHGIITNCGKAHLEGFGGIDGVRKGKGELYDFIREHNGIIFMNTDYDYLWDMSKGITQRITYGTSNADIVGMIQESNSFFSVQFTKGTHEIKHIQTQLVGDYNLPNVLCAVTVGKHFHVPEEKIKAAIEAYQPNNSRSQLMAFQNNHVILDAYNANPTSMKYAIENFAKMPGEKKVVMIGGMMELGDESIEEHQDIVNLLQQFNWHAVILVGGDFRLVKHSYLYLNNSWEAGEWLREQNLQKASILIKGSRSIQMEKIINP
ncbi:UDP-N-acetylmuramoyl-tripeptide--D-alanyl-D-alanine ligase [Hydrotalea sp.]|uniref:UDP-N-acetylmuramoyl-tripeptide--D-alanyl-D- alanine ligase n=1 Tax=Hydrotalea sp. TaxID=2881279 RepID=UPI002636149B|nr:UDP-N-acetylmuramoyl-tripeptide--D-alanyl-D-alanine ligase [Hydrotalea sp.]